MKYLIIAGGIGLRMGDLVKNTPKSLLKYKGKELIFHVLDHIKENDSATIITGYLGHMVEDAVKKNYPNLNVKFIENKEYKTTNTAYPLWLAKDELMDGFTYLNADIMPDKKMFDDLDTADNVMFVDQNKHFYNNIVKFSPKTAKEMFSLKMDKNEKAYDLIFKILGQTDFKVIDCSDYNWKTFNVPKDLEE